MIKKTCSALIILICTILIIVHIENRKNESVKLANIADHEKKTFILDSTNVMRYTADQLIEKTGIPLSDSIFKVSKSDRRRRFLFDSLTNNPNSNGIIREQTWRIDSINRLNIWFIEKGGFWEPFSFQFFMFDDDF